MFIDTHCHIHEIDYALSMETVLARATAAQVSHMLCVGTNEDSSRRAVTLANNYQMVSAVIGTHPHEAETYNVKYLKQLLNHTQKTSHKIIVGIGEIGLDYYYETAPRTRQIEVLESQLQLAQSYNLPVSFHVRDGLDDFWPLFDNFSGVRGVLHSFTDSAKHLERALTRNLMIGVNGISLFTKNVDQQAMYAAIPVKSLLLETDAPFLTPPPYRGTINEPAYVALIGAHHAALRGIEINHFANITSSNAASLFNI